MLKLFGYKVVSGKFLEVKLNRESLPTPWGLRLDKKNLEIRNVAS